VFLILLLIPVAAKSTVDLGVLVSIGRALKVSELPDSSVAVDSGVLVSSGRASGTGRGGGD